MEKECDHTLCDEPGEASTRDGICRKGIVFIASLGKSDVFFYLEML